MEYYFSHAVYEPDIPQGNLIRDTKKLCKILETEPEYSVQFRDWS